MPQPRRDDALTTLQIFDDATYLREALGLPVNQTEDDVDAQLALLARESGIEDPYRFLCPVQDISRALSTTTTGSARSSSLSIYSHQTQSTGFTDRSRTSREQPHVKRLPPQQITSTLARASIAVDSPMEYFPSNFKQRHSTASTFSAERSMSSSASSLHKTSTRRKRASFLSMFRRDSSTCTSPSHHKHHGKHRGPKLECGHSLSTSAIRAHIKEALQAQTDAIPSCCNIPLPRATLEVVLTNEETDRVLEGAVKSPELSSLRDSGYSENGMSSIELPRAVQKTLLPTVSKSLPNTPPRRISIHVPAGSLASEALKSFKAQQKEELERVSAFESKQRKDLKAHQRYSLKQLAFQHKDNKDERKEQHILELEDLEDAQINVEDTLRKAQDLETQNVATALKHMEAYCLSSNPDSDLAHTVTQDDFKRLDLQRLIQQSLPRKHQSAINVLRSRQDRTMKLKIQKQEAELAEMDADFEKEKAAEELQHAQESERLDAVIGARRKRLQQRWDLKYEMWRKDWDNQHGNGTHFENMDWPLKTQYGGPICGIPESSETMTSIHAAA